MPKHFEPNAHRVYSYRDRKPGWVKRKRMRGIRENLVWTGNMKDMMIHRRRISSTRKKARIRVPAPPHLHLGGKDDEVSRMIPRDEQEIEKVGEAALELHLDRVSESMAVQETVI